MIIFGQRILITGATGGIGKELALALAKKGAELYLVGTRHDKLKLLQQQLSVYGGQVHIFPCDLSDERGVQQLQEWALYTVGGVDVLIHCAGITYFGQYTQQSSEHLAKLWQINVMAPMQLTRALLPEMQKARHGRIVNIGSIFGSIGFAYFTAYSASKFAIRGFSEALRRELADSGVGVTYVAPRYTETPLNDSVIHRMAQAVGMRCDTPSLVAQHIVRAIERDRGDCYIGWPEKLFVRINAVLPRLVDRALHQQNAQAREFTINL